MSEVEDEGEENDRDEDGRRENDDGAGPCSKKDEGASWTSTDG